MLPIANIEAPSLGIERDAHRTEVRRRVLEKLFLRRHAIARAVAREAHPEDLLFTEIAEEEVAAIFLRQRVFVVTQRAGGRAAAEVVHHPKRVGPARNKVIRITVESALHHVGQAAHPVMLVGVVVGEHFILVVERHVEDVPHPGAIDLQLRAVRSQPKNAATHLDPFPVASHRAVNSLVAHRAVKIAVHRESEISGDVVVPIQRPRIRVHRLDQFAAVFTDAVVVGEHAELRIVQDVEFAFEVLQPENRVKLLRKHGPPAVGMKAENPAFLRVGVRRADVHGIFGHEDSPIGRDAHHGWMSNIGRLRDEFHAPAGRRLRSVCGTSRVTKSRAPEHQNAPEVEPNRVASSTPGRGQGWVCLRQLHGKAPFALVHASGPRTHA